MTIKVELKQMQVEMENEGKKLIEYLELTDAKIVRLSVGNGFTREIKGVYVKPMFSIDVNLTGKEDVSETVQMLSDYVDAVINYEIMRALLLAGVK